MADNIACVWLCSGQKLEKIVRHLENLIVYENAAGEEDEADYRYSIQFHFLNPKIYIICFYI